MKVLSVSDKLKAFYDDYYTEGESEWRWAGSLDKVNNIVTLCNPYPHKTVLEVGSGEGSILKGLSDFNFAEELYSLEISRTAVETIHGRDLKELAECKLFDGYNIPYDDDKFDLVILSHILEHLEYPRKMLYEASRVGKYVFIEVPLEDHLRVAKKYVPDRAGHINFYSLKTISRLVQTSELEILSCLTTIPSYRIFRYSLGRKTAFVYWPLKLLLQLVPNIATLLFTYHCSFVCKKKRLDK
jgi:ubiquinone/menaquinone biosynthesis C-methylase UbiE